MPHFVGLALLPGDIEITLAGNVKHLLTSDSPIPDNWTDAKAETAAAATWLNNQIGDNAFVHIYTRTPLDVAVLIQNAGTPPPPANWWVRP